MEKELEKVRGALEDIGKKMVDVVKKSKGEADKVTKIAQIRIEIGSLNRQQKDLYTELGELFYRNCNKPSKGVQDQIAETVTHVAEVDKKIASLTRQLKAVRSDKAVSRRGRPPRKAAEAEKAAPKRRGRPPKKAAEAEKAAPKRRGRPPKKAGAAAAKSAPKRRGRPSKKTGAVSTQTASKRRGRPPKSKTE